MKTFDMILDMIFGMLFEILIKPIEWYENWKYPKKFKVGDRVRDKTQEHLWQDLTVEKYDFYHAGRWWLYCKDNDNKYLSRYTSVPFREYQLELLPPEFLPYDPKQQGDTDEDV